jgi:hypothetical protein
MKLLREGRQIAEQEVRAIFEQLSQQTGAQQFTTGTYRVRYASEAEEGEVRAAVRKLRELEQLERTLHEQLLMQSPAARIDLEQIQSTLRQFALAWELMTEAERHEVVTLVVERVQVRRKDAFDVHLAVPDSNGGEEWLPISRSVRISAKVVAIPREGIQVAEVSLRGQT